METERSGVVSAWVARWLRRRELARLETYRLPDIGMSEAERRRECAKWFWQQ